jgi:hypothetical protein
VKLKPGALVQPSFKHGRLNHQMYASMNTTTLDPIGPFTFGILIALATETEGIGKNTVWALIIDSALMRLGWVSMIDVRSAR